MTSNGCDSNSCTCGAGVPCGCDIAVLRNPHLLAGEVPEFLRVGGVAQAYRFHQSIPTYGVTPLVPMTALARELGIKNILVKDESKRFGLNAFKGLGGSYAIFRVVCERFHLDPEKLTFSDLQTPEMRKQLERVVFITATDGNHGKGVAWTAGLLGCKAVVLMPKGSSPVRAQAIRDAGGAEVTITELGYDDTVRLASRMARDNDWTLVQDTSWKGYEKIPQWIVQGYTTLAMEAARQAEALNAVPTHVFLQAGVGAMAGGVLGFLADYYSGKRPVFSVVEASTIACIFASAKAADGEPHAVEESGQTIMAGLNCGEPCTVTWPVLRDFSNFYFSCPDYISAEGMRIYKNSAGIVSGESGAVTLGLLVQLLRDAALADIKKEMNLGPDSVALLLSTEGDTDPECYAEIVNNGMYPLPKAF